jgi:DNA replication protein DnaD
MEINQIDYRYILVDSYKEMGLNENELAILLVMDTILKKGACLITAETLALKMNLDVKDLDAILTSLMKREYIEFAPTSDGNGLVSSLNPLFTRIQEKFTRDIVIDHSIKEDENKNRSATNLYKVFEEKFKRSLSPTEFERIRNWIGQGIDEKVIVECLNDVASHVKKITINSVDKEIVKRLSSKQIEKEGYSPVNEKWRKDLEETIDIANTKWTDD